MKKQQTIEIARSYSEKVKIGSYLTADFFMSANAEVSLKEAEVKSKELYNLCVRDVQKSIEEYKRTRGISDIVEKKVYETPAQKQGLQTKADEIGEEAKIEKEKEREFHEAPEFASQF